MAASDPRENHKLFQDRWNQGDVEGLIDLYEESAILLASAEQALTGHGEIRKMLEQMVAMKIRNELELLSLTENGDIALEKTRWTMQIPGEDGRRVEQSGFSTVVLRRQADDCWRMIIDDPGL
jgi:uncharacterized protein (TIGR02246 family)